MANEKRLIEARYLTSQMYLICEAYQTENIFIDAIIDEIDNAPTVDAVEVVRCRDCFANGCCSVQIDLDMGGEGYCPKGRRISRREFESAAEIWNGYAGRERKDNERKTDCITD